MEVREHGKMTTVIPVRFTRLIWISGFWYPSFSTANLSIGEILVFIYIAINVSVVDKIYGISVCW